MSFLAFHRYHKVIRIFVEDRVGSGVRNDRRQDELDTIFLLGKVIRTKRGDQRRNIPHKEDCS